MGLTHGNSWEETNHLFFRNRELSMVVACSISPKKWLQREKVSVQEALITCSTNACHGWSLPPPSARDKAVARIRLLDWSPTQKVKTILSEGLVPIMVFFFVKCLASIRLKAVQVCSQHHPILDSSHRPTLHTRRLRWTSESTRSWYLTFSQSSYFMTSVVKCWWIVNFSHDHQLLSFKWNGGPHDSKDVL